MQVVVVGAWWLLNAGRLSAITGESWRDFAGVLLIFAWSATSLRLAFSLSAHCATRTVCYWVLTAGPLALFYRDQVRWIVHFIQVVPASILCRAGTKVP